MKTIERARVIETLKNVLTSNVGLTVDQQTAIRKKLIEQINLMQ